MTDTGGHQMAHIEYPGLPVEYVMEMVHRFYDEYYFRPKAAARVVWKAIVNRDVPPPVRRSKVLYEASRAATTRQAARPRKKTLSSSRNPSA